MRFSLSREAFLKPLQQVVNVVERRQTLPVLSNLLVQVENGQLSLKGTDLEVELAARCSIDDGQDGEVTIPARKLFDIVRALPDGSKDKPYYFVPLIAKAKGHSGPLWGCCCQPCFLVPVSDSGAVPKEKTLCRIKRENSDSTKA